LKDLTFSLEFKEKDFFFYLLFFLRKKLIGIKHRLHILLKHLLLLYPKWLIRSKNCCFYLKHYINSVKPLGIASKPLLQFGEATWHNHGF